MAKDWSITTEAEVLEMGLKKRFKIADTIWGKKFQDCSL